MKYQTAAILLSLMTSSTFAADTPALIPLPQKMECREGAFKLQPKTRILTDVPARDTGQYLAERLVKATSYDIQNATSTGAQPALTPGSASLPPPIISRRLRPWPTRARR